MKNQKLFLLMVILFCGFYTFAQESDNEKQRELRTYYSNFLLEEGFSPKPNNFGNLEFKKEGNTYWINIGDDTKSLYLTLQRSGFSINSDESLEKCYIACSKLNSVYKVGKAYVSSTNENVVLVAQTFLKNEEEFKYIFYRLMNAVDGLYKDFQDEYNNAQPLNSTNQSAVNRTHTVFDELFPVYDVVLGQTSLSKLSQLGYNVEKYDTQSSNCKVNQLTFWDHDGDKIVEQIYTTCYNMMPDLWKQNLGFDWHKSYNEWNELLRNAGFTVNVIDAPTVKMFSSRRTLSASLQAVSNNFEIELDFDYGNDNKDGCSTDSKNSLYSMTFRVKK